MMKESFDASFEINKPERAGEHLADAEQSHETALARLRKLPALNTVVRGVLGLTTAVAVQLHEHEAMAAPSVKLSFTEIDPHAPAKEERFTAEAETAKQRAISKKLEPLHDRGMQLLLRTDTNEPEQPFSGDLLRLLNEKSVVFDELVSTYKYFDANAVKKDGRGTASRARIQSKVYALSGGAERGAPHRTTEMLVVQHVGGGTRNTAVLNALALLALRAQQDLSARLTSESLTVQLRPTEGVRRMRIVTTKAFHVSHLHTTVVLNQIHVAVKEVVVDGQHRFEAAASAQGSVYRATAPDQLAHK